MALQHNTNIETLGLSRLADIYAIPILEGLGINTSVKTFIFSHSSNTNVSDATLHALHQLLESTTSIQRFEWENASCSATQFCPIAQAITSSESLSELKLFACAFTDREAEAPFRSILQDKRNLSSLCLHHCNFGGGQVHEDYHLSLLLRPDSPLRCFEFWIMMIIWKKHFRTFNSRTCFEPSKRASWNDSRLEAFETQQQLQTLTAEHSVDEIEGIGGSLLS